MSSSEIAKERYNQSGNDYVKRYSIKKLLSETYTSLKYLQDKSKNFAKDLRILDLGCGGGEFIIESLRHGARHVSGLDISETMIKAARANLLDYSAESYTLGLCDCLNPRELLNCIGDEKYDNIVANWLINYSEDYFQLVRFFKGCHQVLKPGGRVSGIFTNESVIEHTEEAMSKMQFKVSHYQILQKYEDFANARLQFLNPQTAEILFELNINIFTKNSVRKALEEANFEIIKIGPVEYSPDIADFNYSPEHFRAYTEEIGIEYCFVAVSRKQGMDY